MNFFWFIPLLTSFLFVGCTKTDLGGDLCGAEEFVLDSYKLRGGTLSILEMEGIFLNELKNTEGSKGKVQITGLPEISIDEKTSLATLLETLPLEKVSLFKSRLVREGAVLGCDFGNVLSGDEIVYMKNGDRIVLEPLESSSCFVIGEKGNQAEVFLSKGVAPLRKVLCETKQLPFLNNSVSIQVVRAAMPKPKIYSLEWELIHLLPDQSLLVMEGDVIYLSSALSGKLHHLILNLLPEKRKTD